MDWHLDILIFDDVIYVREGAGAEPYGANMRMRIFQNNRGVIG